MNKISRRELLRQNNSLREQMNKLINANKDSSRLNIILATKLYILDPSDIIFSNGSLKEEFLNIVKESAKKSLESLKK